MAMVIVVLLEVLYFNKVQFTYSYMTGRPSHAACMVSHTKVCTSLDKHQGSVIPA